ncbi:unnamed protein product [Brassica napus]|uniref:(rape) hypothetical protein n=1 Tax=Brassica napus TaxID=3708 RepID=A0A816JFB4_BRANA|nr:unnamed protein product [Brassica napus]
MQDFIDAELVVYVSLKLSSISRMQGARNICKDFRSKQANLFFKKVLKVE